MEAKLFARKSRNFSDASGREVDYGSKLISKSIRAKVKYVLSPLWCNVVQISGPTGPNWSLIIIWICSREIPEGELFL